MSWYDLLESFSTNGKVVFAINEDNDLLVFFSFRFDG